MKRAAIEIGTGIWRARAGGEAGVSESSGRYWKWPAPAEAESSPQPAMPVMGSVPAVPARIRTVCRQKFKFC
ncbi:MAG: hypothetical protein KME26_22130 [Oscillatoria princeps RMCB-10]|nr:hypothetical protein [Oscillatoria princeps RMCB-10]